MCLIKDVKQKVQSTKKNKNRRRSESENCLIAIPTNSSPLPTSSITKPGNSIDRLGNAVEVVTKGRHDPCVGIRAVPIAEAVLAIVIMDHYLRHRAQNADVVVETPKIAAQRP